MSLEQTTYLHKRLAADSDVENSEKKSWLSKNGMRDTTTLVLGALSLVVSVVSLSLIITEMSRRPSFEPIRGIGSSTTDKGKVAVYGDNMKLEGDFGLKPLTDRTTSLEISASSIIGSVHDIYEIPIPTDDDGDTMYTSKMVKSSLNILSVKTDSPWMTPSTPGGDSILDPVMQLPKCTLENQNIQTKFFYNVINSPTSALNTIWFYCDGCVFKSIQVYSILTKTMTNSNNEQSQLKVTVPTSGDRGTFACVNGKWAVSFIIHDSTTSVTPEGNLLPMTPP